MSDYIDKAKDIAKDLTDKARGAVTDHSDTIDGGIDKAADFVDEKTKGKYSDHIGTVRSKAHEVVDKITIDDEGDGAAPPSDDTPPGDPAGGDTPPGSG